MKILKVFIRILLLVVIAVFGFFAIFPNAFEATKLMFSQTNQAIPISSDDLGKSTKDTSNPCAMERETYTPKNYSDLAKAPDSPNANLTTPKILINRDPGVFDVVCVGDTLRYNVFSENVDRIMLTYDNEESESFGYSTINPALFRNAIEFQLPKDFVGASSISATGFVKGKAFMTTSKVTFTILENETTSTVTKSAGSQSVEAQWARASIFDGTKTERLNLVSFINESTISFGRIRLHLNQLAFDSTTQLNNSNATATLVVLNEKMLKDTISLNNVVGELTVSKLNQGNVELSFNFNANLDDEINYEVTGEAIARYKY